jgi:hypothetical protein
MTWSAAWAALKGAGRLLRGFSGGALVGLAAGAFLMLELAGRGTPSPAPYVAQPTKRAADAPKVVEAVPLEILKPAPKVRRRIAADYEEPAILVPGGGKPGANYSDSIPGTPGPLAASWAKELVAEVKFGPAPDGGTILATYDRATGKIEPKVLEAKGSLRNRWEIVGGYGVVESAAAPGLEAEESWQRFWEAEGRWTPACRRRVCAEFAAGWRKLDGERGRAFAVARPKFVGGR